ncbi:deoxyguanosinetriphosphate triphosphohydrolase family protein [Desulfuromonas sp. TF]|uniref:deoxyguanosinetriphosphate triphosphohydrolase family protein n=1 Tax=Desulfuromonas sp. TF TaxID=1232410 RepID=UPI0003FF777C|nr:HD domain-containing protein [Desulfuromonas sp. TF]
MGKNSFAEVALNPSNPKWNQSVSRVSELYRKTDDIRSEFARDFTRILHCNAYRRLKHKTQVFFATQNDHICTRIEHVNHVSSVSQTISQYLGLNTELTSAIAIGHDLGHAPFGHAGETVIKKIAIDHIGDSFWHERNSLRFVDEIETLPDSSGRDTNMNLTYAVRDGIVSHCGEVDETGLRPRDMAIDLTEIVKPNQYAPFSWEACVVKVSDKVAYLGRDIEDAIRIGILTYSELKKLKQISGSPLKEINNTIIMHDFIVDLCNSSSPEIGISFSEKHLELINNIKKFNYETIYFHPRLENYKKYVELVIRSIFESLKVCYNKMETPNVIKSHSKFYPKFSEYFFAWLNKYSNASTARGETGRLNNKVIYDMNNERQYHQAIIDFITAMSDQFAIKSYNELTSF